MLPHLRRGCKKCSQPPNSLTGKSPGMVQRGSRLRRRTWRRACANVSVVLLWLGAAETPMAATGTACQSGQAEDEAWPLPPSARASRAERAPEGGRCSGRCCVSHPAICSPQAPGSSLRQPGHRRALRCCAAWESPSDKFLFSTRRLLF